MALLYDRPLEKLVLQVLGLQWVSYICTVVVCMRSYDPHGRNHCLPLPKMAEQPAMQQALAMPMDGHGGVYPVHDHLRQYQDYPQFEGTHIPYHQDYPFADESAPQLSPPDDIQRCVV